MKPDTKRSIGIIVFTLLYPISWLLVRHIPNPMVPGAIVALNMILPVLAGYFYGPFSGALTGSAGTALSALAYVNMFDGLAVFPHMLMGWMAGWVGAKYRSDIPSAATILVGHSLNMAFYLRLGLITIPPDKWGVTLLGLVTEALIDIVAIVLATALLKRWLYHRERW